MKRNSDDGKCTYIKFMQCELRHFLKRLKTESIKKCTTCEIL